jgi:hypothetical protein
MAAAPEEPNDRWTITFRALSAFGPEAVCALLEDAQFDAKALKRRAPRQLCSRGDTLLTRAARLGNMAAAQQLLKLGADLEWPTGETDLSPLQVACHCGHDRLVTFFLGRGASISRRNNRGLSAVSTAVHTPNVKCLDVLAKHGADLRSRGLARGNTLAQSAASRGNVAALQYLAQKGVNLFERDYRGSTSLDAAAKQRSGAAGPDNATLEFLHDVLKVGGAAASGAWAKHERRGRRLPVVILRSLVVRGRAVALRDATSTEPWKRSLRFLVNALDERRQASPRSDEEGSEENERKRARLQVCNEGPFRHIVSFL